MYIYNVFLELDWEDFLEISYLFYILKIFFLSGCLVFVWIFLKGIFFLGGFSFYFWVV